MNDASARRDDAFRSDDLGDLSDIQGVLDLADLDEREILADLPPPEEGDEALVRRALEPEFARVRAASDVRVAPRWRVPLLQLAPIAALLLLGVALHTWLFGVDGGEDSSDENYLRHDDARMSPTGVVSGSYPVFTWGYERPPGGGYQVVIRDLSGEELLTSDELIESRWELTSEQERALPDRIEWILHLIDSGGGVIRSHPTTASRSG